MTGVFGLKDVSGVGVSFGAERIYDVMLEKELFPDDIEDQIKIIILAMDQESHEFGFSVVNKLRKANIASDIYPDPVKFNKQMKYANARKIPFVVVIGENERKNGLLSLKNMVDGTQSQLSVDELIIKFS